LVEYFATKTPRLEEALISKEGRKEEGFGESPSFLPQRRRENRETYNPIAFFCFFFASVAMFSYKISETN